jgi:hypothetical protein
MKKIMQLLLEDLTTYKDPTSVRTSDDRSNSYVNSKLPNNWETITDKPRKPKKVNRTTHDQQLIPVIPTTNRYNALHNLQNDLELPRRMQNHHIKKDIIMKQKTQALQKERKESY